MNYIFTESDELLYEALYDTTDYTDLSIKENLLEHFKELKTPIERNR